MCGFLFVYSQKPIDKPKLDAALALISHRGPDASTSEVIDNKWYLGHQRLKVIDLEDRSTQPLWDSASNIGILFNGEIYNFNDLKKRFHLNTKTTSDTEIILLLYKKIGRSMLDYLDGMFSILIFDKRTKEIFAARDRLGIKPLYTYTDANFQIFCSEISPILKITNSSTLCEEGMRQYRVLRTFFNNKTAYKNIQSFPSAHYFEKNSYHRYWELPQGPQSPPSDEELSDLVQSAVKNCLIADVPVGSFLSGGLDSTIIASLANCPNTWSVGFPDSNEFEWAEKVATCINTTHVSMHVSDAQFFHAIEELTQMRLEPLTVPNEPLIYLLAKKAKIANTVMLSGEGADELFFGYDRVFRWAENTKKFDILGFSEIYAYSDPHKDLEIIESVIAPFKSRGTPLEIVAGFFQIAHLHGLLRRLDAATMAASVEARPPFCDHRLVERLAGVPFSYKMQNGTVKAPLKRLFREILPASIINRPKVGFPLPLKRLFPTPSNERATSGWLRYCENEFFRVRESI